MIAFTHWTAMHAWWCARRTERAAIGKPWAPRAATKIEPGDDESHTHSSVTDATSTPPARVLDLAKERMATDAAHRCPNPTVPDGECDPNAHSEPPDEGGIIDPALYGAAKAQYEALGPEAKAWMTALVLQGKRGHSWKLNERHSVRRFELYRGVITLAGEGYSDDDIVRAIVHLVLGDDIVLQPTFTAGVVLGLLDYEQAAKFAEVACDLTRDRYLLVYQGDGTPGIQAVA